MRIPQTYFQKIKAGLHFTQAFFIFIAGCLALTVLTKDGQTGGQVGFFLALCFLTLPGLIYEVMVPMWTRAWRFANVYAYASIDLLYTLLWFAAFIAVAVWQSEGLKEGAKKKDAKDGAGSCAQFGYGSASKCEVTKAAVGFGVMIWLLFAATSAISIHGVLQFRRTGIMPNGNSKKHGQAEHLAVDDPSKDAWSTNTDELDANHPSNRPSTSPGDDDPRRAYGQLPSRNEDEQDLLHRSSLQAEDPFADTHSMTEHGMHPGRALSRQSNTGLSITAPSYHEPPSGATGLTSPSGYVAPSALSPSDYEQTPGGRFNFPQGNYGADFR